VPARSAELDRQVDRLAALGYPDLAGLGEAAFRRRVEPLHAAAERVAWGDSAFPFVLVVTRALVPVAAALPLVEWLGRRGWTDLPADDLARFVPVDGVDVPDAEAYLVTDVDTGRETLDVTPDDALPRILGAGRSPLTVDEGLALLTQHPGVLRTHNAYSVLASRCGDRRVPAFWVSKGAPRLGWCWAGNPHSWLGSASCRSRVAA
jgi:hypothetical protein